MVLIEVDRGLRDCSCGTGDPVEETPVGIIRRRAWACIPSPSRYSTLLYSTHTLLYTLLSLLYPCTGQGRWMGLQKAICGRRPWRCATPALLPRILRKGKVGQPAAFAGRTYMHVPCSTCEEKGREEKKDWRDPSGVCRRSRSRNTIPGIIRRAGPLCLYILCWHSAHPPDRHTPPAMVYHKPRKSCLDCRRRHLKCSLPDSGGSASCVWCQEHGLECVKDWEAADSGPLRSQPAKDG